MQFTEHFWTQGEHVQNELPTKKHTSFTDTQTSAAIHATHQKVNFILTVNLVLLIKSITGTILFPVLSQYLFVSSFVRGLKGAFWSRKRNKQTRIMCLFIYILHRGSSKVTGKPEEERGGWGELSGLSGPPVQRKGSQEAPQPLSFSKDHGGPPRTIPAI